MDRRTFIKSSTALIAAGTMNAFAQQAIWKRSTPIVASPDEGDTIHVNGIPLYFSTPRDAFDPVGVIVRDWNTGAVVTRHPCGWIFGSFFQDVDGVIYAYGATAGAGFGNSWVGQALNANFAPVGRRVTLWQANPGFDRVWNSGVARTDYGEYISVLEVAYNGPILQVAPHPLGPWRYVCSVPLGQNAFLDWLDGYLYAYSMWWDGISQWRTYVARSKTWWSPVAWEFSYEPVVIADGPGPEGNDASDYSHNMGPDGVLRGNYFVGDQVNWIHVKPFMFVGTRRQYVQKFFGDPSMYHTSHADRPRSSIQPIV